VDEGVVADSLKKYPATVPDAVRETMGTVRDVEVATREKDVMETGVGATVKLIEKVEVVMPSCAVTSTVADPVGLDACVTVSVAFGSSVVAVTVGAETVPCGSTTVYDVVLDEKVGLSVPELTVRAEREASLLYSVILNV
jgi:hypothetical protein